MNIYPGVYDLPERRSGNQAQCADRNRQHRQTPKEKSPRDCSRERVVQCMQQTFGIARHSVVPNIHATQHFPQVNPRLADTLPCRVVNSLPVPLTLEAKVIK
jgi:hypothetical protein